MVVVSRLRTTPRSHFICSTPCLPLLYSSQTRLYLSSSHFIQTTPLLAEGHQGFTTNSHSCQTNALEIYLDFLHCIDCQTLLNSLVWSALLFVSYRRDKSVKDKDKYKDKTVKEAPSCFPPGPNSFAGLTPGSSPAHHIYPPPSHWGKKNRRHLFTDEHILLTTARNKHLTE